MEISTLSISRFSSISLSHPLLVSSFLSRQPLLLFVPLLQVSRPFGEQAQRRLAGQNSNLKGKPVLSSTTFLSLLSLLSQSSPSFCHPQALKRFRAESSLVILSIQRIIFLLFPSPPLIIVILIYFYFLQNRRKE